MLLCNWATMIRTTLVVLGTLVGLMAHAEQAVPANPTPPPQLNDATTEQPDPQKMSPGEQYVLACATELAKLGRPNAATDCEQLIRHSHLIQSDAIRYLTAASDKERQAFAELSTLGRFEVLEPDVDPSKITLLILSEHKAPGSRMAVQLAKDVMQPGCGYYQIELMLKALDNAHALPQVKVARAGKGKDRQAAHESCVSKSQDAAQECLNPVFQVVTSEPSPNP